ncbi:DUF4382 domain-containing protein [Haloferax sp. DFSO52]|uniref:DUF4382 domain-containing protein n=1 Tax=Haloferax sp. DFSO52 TaxID=3388505 RepID=UPI003A8B2EA7
MVVLAGCAGGAGTLTESPQSNGATDSSSSSSGSAGETGTVNFYVSDEENAIEDFESLNVTIERVTFISAEGGDDESVDAESEENDSEADDSEENESAEETGDAKTNASSNPKAKNATANATASANASANETETAENETEVEEAADAEAESESKSEPSGQVTYTVKNVTVDLTELKGDKSSLVGAYDVPKGEYNAVHVEVTNVSGTLKTGEQVNIKLPSNKLKLNSDFTVEKGESVNFVFDITAFEAGGSGKYILKPVISESGTDVPIENVDEEADEEVEESEEAEEAEAEEEERSEDTNETSETDESAALNVTFDGNVTTDENVTLTVTQNGSAVENATVAVNDEVVGTTDANGTLVVDVPDSEEMTVKVTHDDAEAEFEFELAVETVETGEDDSKKPDSPGKSDNSND